MDGNVTQEPVRVSFGPHPSDTLPVEWAQRMLTEWAASQPAVFGRYLARAALNGRGKAG